MHDVLASYAFRGFLGALWLAGPIATAQVYAARRQKRPWTEYVVLGVLSVIGGTSAAWVATNYIAARFNIADHGTAAFSVGFGANLWRAMTLKRMKALLNALTADGAQ